MKYYTRHWGRPDRTDLLIVERGLIVGAVALSGGVRTPLPVYESQWLDVIETMVPGWQQLDPYLSREIMEWAPEYVDSRGVLHMAEICDVFRLRDEHL